MDDIFFINVNFIMVHKLVIFCRIFAKVNTIRKYDNALGSFSTKAILIFNSKL